MKAQAQSQGMEKRSFLHPFLGLFSSKSTFSSSAVPPTPSSYAELTDMKDRPDKHGRRRPFSTWMKKLANFKDFKGGSDGNPSANGKEKRNTYQMKSSTKKASKHNNPYPESTLVNGSSAVPVNDQQSYSTGPTGHSTSSLNRSRPSVNERPLTGNKSTAATVNTDIAHSDAAQSHTASSGDPATTVGGMSNGRGVDSTFSSPAPSVRSLTTTLTTIHSAVAPAPTSNGTSTSTNSQPLHFSHQFPTSPPPTALPAHLQPHGNSSGGHPSTYGTATANNLLTDNASILTLASSSKRRRRRSMDTDASVRALAPSSLFGGSRESLPLSVLSATVEAPSVPSAMQSRANVGGLNERASIYSASGVAVALPSERNSYYAGKQSAAADGASIKSGLLGHGRNDSISGSIGGAPGSPLGPRDAAIRNPSTGGLSRTNSAWGEEGIENDNPSIREPSIHIDDSIKV